MHKILNFCRRINLDFHFLDGEKLVVVLDVPLLVLLLVLLHCVLSKDITLSGATVRNTNVTADGTRPEPDPDSA